MAHYIKITLSGSDSIIMGDWCYENLKEWAIINPNRTMFCNDILWPEHRWNFQGLSDAVEVELELEFGFDDDAMAFKLRWM